MASSQRRAPFSTHSRGVPLFDRGRFLDLSRHSARALLDLRDIGSSAFWFVSIQSWLTAWSLIVDIVSLCFFYFYKKNSLAGQLDFIYVAFTVVLPLTGFVWIAYLRRERSLSLLSEAKCLIISIINAHLEWNSNVAAHDSPSTGSLVDVQVAVAMIINSMRAYFTPARFYSRSYPYLGYKSAMVQIALDRGRIQRHIRDSIAALGRAAVTARSSGLPHPLEAVLHERSLRLSIVIDHLSNFKEYGTPQGIRSLARLYITLIIPLFWGPYWAWFSLQTNFALAFFTSLAVQISLVGVLNVALDLEDPFNNEGMDGIFVNEYLYDVEMSLIASGASPEIVNLLNTNGSSMTPNGRSPDSQHPRGAGSAEALPPRTVRVATDTV